MSLQMATMTSFLRQNHGVMGELWRAHSGSPQGVYPLDAKALKSLASCSLYNSRPQPPLYSITAIVVAGCAVTLTALELGTGMVARSKPLGMTKDTIQPVSYTHLTLPTI